MTTTPWFFSESLVNNLSQVFCKSRDNAFSVEAWSVGNGLYITDNEDSSFSVCQLNGENIETLFSGDNECFAYDVEAIFEVVEAIGERKEVLIRYFDILVTRGMIQSIAQIAIETSF